MDDLELSREALQWAFLLNAFLFILLVGGLGIEAIAIVRRRFQTGYHRRITDMPLKYDDELCNQFVEDMRAAGLEPYHYRGRWFWQGPAVNVDYLQDAMSSTKVPVQHDGMGIGYVVYPRSPGKLISREERDNAES